MKILNGAITAVSVIVGLIYIASNFQEMFPTLAAIFILVTASMIFGKKKPATKKD